jgi:opacity protein-like surface antigen
MRRLPSLACAAFLCFVVLALPGVVSGANFDYANFTGEWGVRLAYGKSTSKASVRLYSLMPRWGMFLVRPGRSLGPFGLSFVVEGILSVADAEQTGFELGITPMLKGTVVLFPGVMAYIEGGAGLITESFNSPAVAHSFNFTPQVGAGFDIALQPRLALSVAYRFRHSSNAGLYNENPAFNVHLFQGGLTYYY